MPVIAIVNRKGGSGKSTLAAHLAAWCARQGSAVMLGDVDRQQSSRGWLRRRDTALPVIAPWALDQKNVLRVPSGITHVVLDTPGGMQGFELARMVMFADAILMPVCHSVFDRESAAACHAELMALPRVASGRCRLATVGMRIDGRTRAADVLREWSDGLGVPFLGALRETQLYVHTLERGLTLFDLPPRLTAQDMVQWEPILNWLSPLLYPIQAANDPSPAVENPSSRLGTPRPHNLMPAQESLVHGGRLSMFAPSRPAQPTALAPARQALPRKESASTCGLQIPQFLKR